MWTGLGRARLAALAVGVAVMAAACAHPEAPVRKANQARVPVIMAKPGAVTPKSTLGGLIVPFQNVQLQSQLAEPALRVMVQEGYRVRKGQVLAILDTADLRAQLQSYMGSANASKARARSTFLQARLTISLNDNTINAAQAALAQAQQTAANDRLNLQRYQGLLSNGYVSQQLADQQRSLVANDEQAVRVAEVALQNARSQVRANGSTSSGLQGATVAAARADQQTALGLANQVRAQIVKAKIVSPIDGVVVNRNLNPGEYPGTRQIFTLQQTDKVFAVLNGSGADIIGVEPGSFARIVSSDRATLRGRAKIVAVLDQVTPGSTNFVVKALLRNPKGSFRSGMAISGTVTRPTAKGLRIPVTAFVDDTQTTVQTIVNGGVQTIPVTVVAADGKNAIVRGLTKGQTIVANGQLGLTDGQKVEPITRPARAVAER